MPAASPELALLLYSKSETFRIWCVRAGFLRSTAGRGMSGAAQGLRAMYRRRGSKLRASQIGAAPAAYNSRQRRSGLLARHRISAFYVLALNETMRFRLCAWLAMRFRALCTGRVGPFPSRAGI